MLSEQIFYLFGQIETSQTGGQRYSDTSPMGSLGKILDTGPVIMGVDS